MFARVRSKHMRCVWLCHQRRQHASTLADHDVWCLRFMCAYHIRRPLHSSRLSLPVQLLHKSAPSRFSVDIFSFSKCAAWRWRKFHMKLELIFVFVIIFVFNRFGLLELIELKIIVNEIDGDHVILEKRHAIHYRRKFTVCTASHRRTDSISDAARMWCGARRYKHYYCRCQYRFAKNDLCA